MKLLKKSIQMKPAIFGICGILAETIFGRTFQIKFRDF